MEENVGIVKKIGGLGREKGVRGSEDGGLYS